MKTAGCPFTDCASAGNCARTHERSSALYVDEDDDEDDDNDKGEAGSAIGIADILIEDFATT
jgi:hypothetical protein